VASRLAIPHAESASDADGYFAIAELAIRKACELMPNAEVLAERERVRVCLAESRWYNKLFGALERAFGGSDDSDEDDSD
jgi:hypothetical protein